MGTLTTMKFNGSRTMHKRVIDLTNVTTRLKSLGMEVEQNLLIQFIINSLPSEYGPFQMNYNTMKDKWNVHELHGMLIQEEVRLKNQWTHSINFVSHQGVGKKGKKHANGKQRHHNFNESSSQVHKKEHKSDKSRFCGKSRHFQKDLIFKAWIEKKGRPSAFTYVESNLTKVPYNTWWIDSGCTVHVSNTMQGFLTTQIINKNERYVYMGNIRVKAPFKAVETYRLILDTRRHLIYLKLVMYLLFRDILFLCISWIRLDTPLISVMDVLVCLNIII